MSEPDYIKLVEPPLLVLQPPLCSTCDVELESEDGWTCPVCGTTWDYSAGDGDAGQLYESWSGEALPGPVLTEDEAGVVGARYQQCRLDEILNRARAFHAERETGVNRGR